MKDESGRFNGHHIWCNYSDRAPVEKCAQCAGLNAKYPYESAAEASWLAAKHFPGAVPRT